LWKEGYAPFIVMAGSGTVHHHKSAWGDFEGKTEAEVFAAKAIEEGEGQLISKFPFGS
jgi:hypothetical protein